MLISISLLCILIHIWVATSSQIGSSTNLVVANREKKDLNIEQNSFIYGWLHGDIGGSAFDDKEELEFPDRTSCVGVEVVWQPSHLYALRFIYGSDDKAGWSMFRGNYTLNSSSREKFMMKPGERITQITTYVGTQGWSIGGKLITFVLGIRFGTNKGRSSQVYGSRSGEKKVEIHDGYVVGHASGRAGILIDQLQFVWQNQETVKVSAEKQFTVLCPDLPESVTLAIISASYRNKEEPKAEVKDVVNRVRQRCNNEKSCSFKVDDEILKTTPCESCPKELEVTYTCSDQEFIFGPEQNDRVYKGHNIMINGKKYLSGVDDYLRCGEYCLKEPKCVGIQFNPDQQCYLKSAMTTYIEKPGWISMAVANRGRDT